ncbi:MAG: hypothetical protein ACKODO_15320, partial [Rhabdaerophilum sp.]
RTFAIVSTPFIPEIHRSSKSGSMQENGGQNYMPIPSPTGSTFHAKSHVTAGKAPKQAITAVMRKMIVLANALLKRGLPWQPKMA